MRQLSKKDKTSRDRRISREVDLELGIEPYKTKIHKNKTKYKRNKRYKDDYREED
jgi:hypothetical protein